MARTGGAHGVKGFGADKGGVTVEDDGIAIGIGQQGGGLRHGMGGAQLRVLQDAVAGVVKGSRGFGDGLSPVTRHDDHARGFQRTTRSKGVVQHRHTGQGMQDLWQVRIHAAAKARGQDDQ
jgi:hypothetical protein